MLYKGTQPICPIVKVGTTPSLQTKTVSITSTSGNTFTPDNGYDGFSTIKVNPTNQSLTITPSTTSQTFTVPSNYSGYGTVTCNAASGGGGDYKIVIADYESEQGLTYVDTEFWVLVDVRYGTADYLLPRCLIDNSYEIMNLVKINSYYYSVATEYADSSQGEATFYLYSVRRGNSEGDAFDTLTLTWQ